MIGVLKDSTAAGGAALLAVTLLTIPALLDHLTRFRETKKAKAALYEDADGVATEESMAKHSNVVPKILLAIFTTLGLLTAIALAVLATVHHDQSSARAENWLNVASWVCFHTRYYLLKGKANKPFARRSSLSRPLAPSCAKPPRATS